MHYSETGKLAKNCSGILLRHYDSSSLSTLKRSGSKLATPERGEITLLVPKATPDEAFIESTLYSTPERLANTKSVRSKTKRSCLNTLGPKRSLFREFTALRLEVRFTGNPILGKSGTRSALWEEKPTPGSSSVSRQDATCHCADPGQSSEKISISAISCEEKARFSV
jgi:hypothetical protein